MERTIDHTDHHAHLESSAPPQSRHTCHCGKNFVRKEHLRRHQLTHSPHSHVCSFCKRSFARRDVLQRHEGLHRSGSRQRHACDACHTRKKKCDGGSDGHSGTSCASCVSQHLRCVYTRLASGLPGIGAQVTEDEDLANCTGRDNICSRAEYSVVMAGLQALRDAVILSVGLPAYETLGDIPTNSKVRDWFASCCESYFAHLHHRWPVIQASTFDLETEPFNLSVAVVMLGCWLQRGGDDIKKLAVELHGTLVQKVSQEMLSLKFTRDSPWSFETYQAIFLNTLFGLLCGTQLALDKTFLLHSLFIAMLRSLRFFSSDAAAYQTQTHFPGNWVPYVMSIREKRKRIISSTYKMDNYLAILRSQPPILHGMELEVGLTSTFSMWNTDGLDTLFKRLADEPMDRSNCTIYELITTKQPLMASGFLVEDIELGLCSILTQIWSFFQVRRVGVSAATDSDLPCDTLLEEIGIWKARLDQISSLFSQNSIRGDDTRKDSLLKAYSGKEGSEMPGREEAVLARTRSLITDARLLHSLLAMALLGAQHDKTYYGTDFSVCPCVRDMWDRLFKAAREYYVP